MSRIPALSIVIPACNERVRLPRSMAAILAWLDAHALDAELILSDDGSLDGTPDLIQDAARQDRRVVPVLGQRNRGKGAALRAGVARSRGASVLFFDADLSYPLDAIDQALDRLATGADLVIGARDLAAGHAGYPLLHRAATTSFHLLVERALGLGIRDTQCGFKAFRGDVARPLFAALTVDRFAFDVELLVLARHWQLRIGLLPIAMTHAAGSSVRLGHDSLRMLVDIAQIRSRMMARKLPPAPAISEATP